MCVYHRKEETVSQIVVKAQKICKKQIPPGLDMTPGSAVHWLLQGVDKSLPNASYFISAAYLVNVYFTHLKNYEECLIVCEEAEKRVSALKGKIGVGVYYDHICSVVLTRKWSVIFDQCIQTVFGFILLHDRCLERLCIQTVFGFILLHERCLKRLGVNTSTSVLDFKSSRSFVLYISPMAFIRYVANNCRRRLRCLPAAHHLMAQYKECSALLFSAVCNDQVIRVTTELHEYLRNFSRT